MTSALTARELADLAHRIRVAGGQPATRKRKRATRRKVDHEYLRELASVYAANPHAPAKAVETWARIAPATASRHIAEARRHGLITTPPQLPRRLRT